MSRFWCTWWSGFFAAPAVVHAIRVAFQWDFVAAGYPFGMLSSGVVVLVAGALSVGFWWKAMRLKNSKKL